MPDKKRERLYFEALRKAVSGMPAGEAVEPEPPDFVLRDRACSLGVELTVFHLSLASGERPHQEQQNLKDQIVETAERIHATAGGPPLYVGVYFSHEVVLKKTSIQPLARAIADSVLQAPMPRSMSEPVELSWGARPKDVWGIQIHPSIDGKDKLWHSDAGGWVADITSAHVADVIRSKSRKAPLARTRCDKLWLVIVQDDFSLAALAQITSEALSAQYTGPFDRVLWLLPHDPVLAIDLKCLTAA